MIELGRYKYRLHASSLAADRVKKLWTCSKYTFRGCRASITTIGGSVIKQKNQHNHE
ncbi:hypothetical protein JYU34_004443 [Plutella xylostella]|uniref:FLYWCH-type domain-containing protein n=1 Tax=Plutella xylostella TaxID=51655 RepID=A0ABQ7QY50_PLUXY|nr:hypothetical protein JYU34_004443 [Plutella xylostella]